jgi:hypothetical protein
MTAQHLPEAHMSNDKKTMHNVLGWALTKGGQGRCAESG